MEIKDLTPEDLDDLVYDVTYDIAVRTMNGEPCEDNQEMILDNAEVRASEINNQGVEAQLKFIKENGLTEEEILKRI